MSSSSGRWKPEHRQQQHTFGRNSIETGGEMDDDTWKDGPSKKRQRRTTSSAEGKQQQFDGGGDGGGGGSSINHKDDDDDEDVRQMERLLRGTTGGNDDDDDDEIDDFEALERRQEEEAAKRRQQRLRRLEKIKTEAAADTSEGRTNNGGGSGGGAARVSTALEAATSSSTQQQQQTKRRKAPSPVNNMPAESASAALLGALSRGESYDGGALKQEIRGVDENPTTNDDDDEFDMFSSSVSPVAASNSAAAADTSGVAAATSAAGTSRRGQEQEDWDDAEGYYKAVIGEIIVLDNPAAGTSTSSSAGEAAGDARTNDRQAGSGSSSSVSFRVAGVIGKGVFSTVLKCTTVSNSTSAEIPPTVAIKCIRHNDTMAKAALKEIKFLQSLRGCLGIVPLSLPCAAATTTSSSGAANDSSKSVSSPVIEYRGHTLLVFPFMEYNLRDVLQKFGKGVGLSLQAVRSYFGQLLAAAIHLRKRNILHSDIKPDNILVSADFSTVQLADFGSAVESDSPEVQVTPYLVSRFYRAPEIILGFVPTPQIDLWSLAVSVAELYLGNVLFRGTSNNDMLYSIMQHLGPFSNRLIRQHLLACDKYPIARHFERSETGGNTYLFKQQTVDQVTGAPVHKLLPLVQSAAGNSSSGGSGLKDGGGGGKSAQHQKFPLATPIHHKLLKARAAGDSRALVVQFSDLLQRCLTLDPNRRVDLRDALKHDFFKQGQKQQQDEKAASATTTSPSAAAAATTTSAASSGISNSSKKNANKFRQNHQHRSRGK